MTQQRRPRQQRATTAVKTRQTGRGPIRFRISRDMLRQLLRLGPDVTIDGATFDPASGLVTFDLDIPNAPDGAEELLVSYRHTGRPDPLFAQSEWRTRDDAA